MANDDVLDKLKEAITVAKRLQEIVKGQHELFTNAVKEQTADIEKHKEALRRVVGWIREALAILESGGPPVHVVEKLHQALAKGVSNDKA